MKVDEVKNEKGDSSEIFFRLKNINLLLVDTMVIGSD